jgi:L-iditol 2-dehydrogenase
MKALLLSSYRNLEIADLPTPSPSAGEALVRVAACGICGSDVHGYDGSSGRRIPPLVMGHEAAGVVTAVGSEVQHYSPGDRVTFDSTVYFGDYRRAGAFAESVSVPARLLHRLPENLPFAVAAMLEAVAVALHAVSLAPTSPGATALVLGAGAIGILILQSLRVAGCSRIFVADVDPARLELARRLGATEVLISNDQLNARLLERAGGQGVDIALEAVGRNETVASCIEAVRKGVTVILVGNISPNVTLPLQKVVTRQIRLQGSCASPGEYPRAIELLSSGAINAKPLITATAPLEEGAQWFERLYAREPNLLKVVLTP